jgi:hypothetical protein
MTSAGTCLVSLLTVHVEASTDFGGKPVYQDPDYMQLPSGHGSPKCEIRPEPQRACGYLLPLK